MKCDDIEQEEIVDRYLLAQLSDEEEGRFEEHCFSCDRCFDRLKQAEKVMQGLRALERDGELDLEEDVKGTWLNLRAWLRWQPSPAFATALIILIVLLAYPAWRGVVIVPRLSTSLEELQRPRADLPSHPLQQSQRGQEESILLAHGEDMFFLHFNLLEKAGKNPLYRAEISNQRGDIVWMASDLKGSGEYEVFSVLCHRSFFGDGSYELTVFEIDRDTGQVMNEFVFRFTIEEV